MPELQAELVAEFNGTPFRLRSHSHPYNSALTHRFAVWRVFRNGDSNPVGVWDCDLEGFTQSLLDGLEFIRQHISDRYDEYQNLDESEYDHFPVTILLEECAEYDGLLSVFNRLANPKESDPGFSAKRYVTAFWKKFFIATRKGNNFGIMIMFFILLEAYTEP